MAAEGPDCFARVLAGCKKLGMIMVARTDPHAAYDEVAEAHPEWIAVDAQATGGGTGRARRCGHVRARSLQLRVQSDIRLLNRERVHGRPQRDARPFGIAQPADKPGFPFRVLTP